MNITCPSCGAEATLDVILTHDEVRRLMVSVLEMSLPLGALVTRYLRLFKPPKQALRPDRIRKLLTQLVPDIQRGQITRKGRDWWINSETWKLGLEAVLDAHTKGTLDLPLQDHAYLHEVLMRMADKQEAREEAERESNKRGNRANVAEPKPIGVVLAQPPQVATTSRYTEPSSYAKRLKAEIEAKRQAREAASKGDSSLDGEPTK